MLFCCRTNRNGNRYRFQLLPLSLVTSDRAVVIVPKAKVISALAQELYGFPLIGALAVSYLVLKGISIFGKEASKVPSGNFKLLHHFQSIILLLTRHIDTFCGSAFSGRSG